MAAAASFRTCSTAVCACTAAGPDSSPGSSGSVHAAVNAGCTLPTHTRPPGLCTGLAGNARPTINARRAALSIFGKMPAELLGKKLWDVYPSSVGTALDLGCRRAMAERLVVMLANAGAHGVLKGRMLLRHKDVEYHFDYHPRWL